MTPALVAKWIPVLKVSTEGMCPLVRQGKSTLLLATVALKTLELMEQLSKNLFETCFILLKRLKAFVWNGLAFRKDFKFIEVFHVEGLESAACCLVPRSGKGIIKRIRVN